MPTRYGSPDATIRTLPHRQPPVNRSMLRLLQNQASEWIQRSLPGARHHGGSRDAHPAYAPSHRTGAALTHYDEPEARSTIPLRAPALPRMRASPAVPDTRSLGTNIRSSRFSVVAALAL